MRKSEQTLNKRIGATFVFLVVALVGFWAGYLFRFARLPRVPEPNSGSPLLLTQFVDVGDGDAAIASSPGGLLLLIDSGPDANAAGSILTQLQRLGRRAPGIILLTNTRARSIGGAAYLVTHCPFHGVVILPVPLQQFARMGGLPARDLISAGKERSLRLVSWQQFDNDLSEAAALSDASVVATPIPVESSRTGVQDLAVRLDLRGSNGEGSVFYAAGLTDGDEDGLLSQRARLSCDVLAATDSGHNGSLTSEFLAQTGPTIVSISASAANPPDAAVLQRLKAADANVQRTDQSGTTAIGLTGKLGDAPIYYGPSSALPDLTTAKTGGQSAKVRPS